MGVDLLGRYGNQHVVTHLEISGDSPLFLVDLSTVK